MDFVQQCILWELDRSITLLQIKYSNETLKVMFNFKFYKKPTRLINSFINGLSIMMINGQKKLCLHVIRVQLIKLHELCIKTHINASGEHASIKSLKCFKYAFYSHFIMFNACTPICVAWHECVMLAMLLW